MANNRRRKTRKSNNLLETISNKNFIIISSILITVIVICIVINIILKVSEDKKIAEEQQRVAKQVEDIYTSLEADISNLDNYKSNSIIRLSAVGDILLGDNLKKYGANSNGLYNDIFTDISKYFIDSDIVIGTYESNINEENKVFANAVKETGLNIVSLAHNHALDDGVEGLNETKKYLETIGIETLGLNSENVQDRVKIKEEKGVKIAFLSYTYDNGSNEINVYNQEKVKEELQYAKDNADFSIVLMHWGDVYKNDANEQQKAQANFLIENGANIIIGAHPSAVQPMEIIKNNEGKDCLVAYSLGDFTSDFKSENSNLELILNLELYYDVDSNEVNLYKADYVPIYMNDYGSKYKENRYKLLDMKTEIANYETEESTIDKRTYEKLIRGIERLNGIIVNDK